MDFGFNEEQELLRSTARKFLANECSSEFVRKRMAEPDGVTDEFWGKVAEQGWLGLVFPEEHGGSGLGFVDLTVLMEEMGRAVMPGPFVSTVLLGGLTIHEAGSAAQRKEWLPKIAAGQVKSTLAWTEPSGRWDAAGVHHRGQAGGRWVGTLGDQALRARCPSRRRPRRGRAQRGEQEPRGGIGLFLVTQGHAGP